MNIKLMRLLNKMEHEGNYNKFEYKGYTYVVLRPRPFTSGHLCGYVQLKETDKNFNCQDPYDLEYDVHSGITFGGVPTMRKLPIKLDGYWLGFDCSHAWDKQPMNDIIYGGLISENCEEKYRDLEYVKKECEKLIDQILEELQ